MNKIIIAIICLISSSVYAQDELEKLTYEDCQNSEVFRGIKNNTKLKQYVASNGDVLSIGDTLLIGVPLGMTTNTTEVGASGDVFGASKSRSRSKRSFETIIMGKPAGFGNVMNAMAGEAPENAQAEMQGEVVVISEIEVNHKGSKKKPLQVQLLLGEPNGRAFGVNKYMSVLDFEKSMKNGELKSIDAPLTRDEAIAKLKESKELMDLGLLKTEDYEKLKLELTPIIMKN